MITIGSVAPDFSLEDAFHKRHTLVEYRGQWVVLYFYPKDNTSGCSLEAVQFTNLKDQFQNENAVVIGISKDSCESHAKFIQKHDLKVVLLSDPEASTIKVYGAWGEKNLYGKKSMGILRTTYIIDPDGKVSGSFIKVKANGHAEQVLQKVKEIKGSQY